MAQSEEAKCEGSGTVEMGCNIVQSPLFEGGSMMGKLLVGLELVR